MVEADNSWTGVPMILVPVFVDLPIQNTNTS